MGELRWHVEPGRRRSLPHTCELTWSGGERTLMLYVLTNHCEWRSCSHESEVATWWRNAIGIVPKLWQQGEPPDDGRHARCSLTPCRQFPLERHQSQMGLLCHVTGRWVNVRAEELGWSLAAGREGLSGLPHDKKPAQSGSLKGWSNSPPSPMAAPMKMLVSSSGICTSFLCKQSTYLLRSDTQPAGRSDRLEAEPRSSADGS